MNQFRGVRRTMLLLGLLACIPGTGAAAGLADSHPLHLSAAPINPHLDLRAPQWCVLDMARDIGLAIGAPKVFQAIVLQESSAGDFLVNLKGPSYGAAGTLLSTANQMNGPGSELTPADLMQDTALDLKLGAAFLALCHARFGAWPRTIICYNKGPSVAAAMTQADIEADDYLPLIKWRLQELRIYRKRASKCPRD